MRGKIIAGILAAMLLVSTFAGCQGKDNTGSSQGSESSKSTSAGSTGSSNTAGGETPTVSFMTWESETMNNAILETLDGKVEGVNVELIPSPLQDYGVKLQEMLAADMAPDIFMVGNDMALNYNAEGLVLDLKSYMDSDTAFTDGFYPGTLETFTSDDKIVGLPGLINMYGVFYNKKYFDDAGIEYPGEDWTFEEMYEIAGKLKDTAGNRYGLYQKTNDVFTLSLYSASKDGTGFCDNIYPVSKVQASDSFKESVSKAAAAIADKSMTEPTFDDTNLVSMFMQGAVPMMRYGQWAADELIRNAPEDLAWGYVNSPKVDKNAQIVDAVGWCINKKTENPDAAFQVLKQLETESYKVVLAQTPVAPPAYQAAAEGYYNTLKEKNHQDLADSLDYMLNAEVKLPVRFLDAWSAKASKFLDADWNAFLTGERGVDEIQSVIVDPINEVIEKSK